MVPEAQFDQWRKDLITNVRKAGEALGKGETERYQLCALIIDMTNRVMLSERIGMLALALNRNDEVLGERLDHIAAGEKIVERLIKVAEASDSDLPEDFEIGLDFLSQWVNPEGGITFTPPDKPQK